MTPAKLVTAPRSFIVTGATGFLGRHLVRTLLRRGDRVKALVRRPPPQPLESDVELVMGDVLSQPSLEAAFDGVDGVFHLAGRVDRSEFADELYELHVDGTANVLRAMKATGVQRVVFASTSGTVAVSDRPQVVGDDAPYATEFVESWPYYQSKIYAEKVADKMAARLGLELVTLRPSLLLGPEDHRGSSTLDVLRFIQGRFPVVPQGGMCFVDARDCAETFANAMDRAAPGGRWLVGGSNMTMRDFFTLVGNTADVDPPALTISRRFWKAGVDVVQRAGRLGWVEQPDPVAMEMAHHYWWCDWSRAVADLDHRPRNPAQTLADTVAWLQAYGDALDTGVEAKGNVLRLPWRPRQDEGHG